MFEIDFFIYLMTLDDELCMGGKINHFNNNHFSDLISKLLLTSIV